MSSTEQLHRPSSSHTNYHTISSSPDSTTESTNGEETSSSARSDYYYEYKKWCGIRRSTWLLTLYVVSYITYLVLGGLAMARLERETEVGLKEKARGAKEVFLLENPSVDVKELEKFLETIFDAKDKGISVLDKHKDLENWTFGQSVLFTVTVVTTIGYGHVSPLTLEGKLFTIVYAICGIPFTLIFLSATVQRLLEPTCKLLTYFFARCGERWTPFWIRVLHLSFLLVIFLVFFMFLPSVIFFAIEPGWGLLDGFYYVFISLTTIGLGDYIPGDSDYQSYREVYKSSVAVYLLLGLVFMTLTATVYYDIPQLNLGLHLQKYRDITLPEERSRQDVEQQVEEEDQEQPKRRESFIKRIFKQNS